MALAGLWEKWKNPESGREVRTFTVITTQANSLLKQIHNLKKRMPVILSREEKKRWLNNNLNKCQVNSLLQPDDSKEMEAYTVDKSVSRRGLNTSYLAVLKEKDYPDLLPLAAKLSYNY